MIEQKKKDDFRGRSSRKGAIKDQDGEQIAPISLIFCKSSSFDTSISILEI